MDLQFTNKRLILSQEYFTKKQG